MSRVFRQIILLLLLAVVPAVVAGWWHPQRPPLDSAVVRTEEISVATAQNWGARTLWVDARSAEEFSQGHIPGALLLNEDQWQQLLDGFLEQWDFDRMVVVYCNSDRCDASKAVAARLKQEFEELENIYVLKGGWQVWSAQEN